MNFKSLTLALATTLTLGAAQAQSLNLTPESSTVLEGTPFSLSVTGKDFATALVGGGFGLSFDPSVLTLNSVVIPAAWEFAPQGGLIDSASGTLSDAAFTTFAAPKAGDFLAATLNFTAKGPGTTTVQLAPSSTFVFTDVDVNPVNPRFGSALVTVSAVPEPSTYALVLAGMGVAAVARRRRTTPQA